MGGTLFLPPLFLKKGKKLGLCPKKHFKRLLDIKTCEKILSIFIHYYGFLLLGYAFNGINVHLFDPVLKEDEPHFSLPENTEICLLCHSSASRFPGN